MKKFFCFESNEINYSEGTHYSLIEALTPDEAAEIFVEEELAYIGDHFDEMAVNVVEEDGTLHELLVVVDYSPSFCAYDRD